MAIGNGFGVAEGPRGRLEIRLGADGGSVEATQAVPLRPGESEFTKPAPDAALGHVVEVRRPAAAPGEDVSASRRALGLPERQEDLAQLRTDRNEALALQCLGRAFDCMPHRADYFDLLVKPNP